jgi:subtilisin family serine protease
MPQPAAYRIEQAPAPALAREQGAQWLRAWPENGSTNWVEFGSRVVLKLKSADDLKRLTTGHPLQLARTVEFELFILQAPDALTAAQEAHRLAALEGVEASYPVVRGRAGLRGPYAPQPVDSCFSFLNSSIPYQWYLENRNADGSSAGMDLNVRAAWPYSLGQGVTIAVADVGVELAHPELTNGVTGAPHFNFITQTTNAGPIDRFSSGAHGTEVAGLACASLNDYRMAGVAPGSGLASWVIFDGDYVIGTDEQLMDMFQYQSNSVAVQNHSWGPAGVMQTAITPLEDAGISNTVTLGRAGRGVVVVRAIGEDRSSEANANDDGYSADPRSIAVAAVRRDGRVASYSDPGACVLVAAPAGDPSSGFPPLLTTDLLGTDGVNRINFFPPFQDMNNYAWGSLGQSGTSFSAPQIAGIAALMLSANPSLSYRDVQQILILASRHFDFADPDVVTNGAGFVVSHNLGFGVPDAGAAVNLARDWPSRPAASQITFTATNPAVIPDDGLRVLITGGGIPANLASIHCLPDTGPHADSPTPLLPLVDFGYGTNLVGYNLTNKAALVQRGGSTFANEISLAAQAGAAFAVVYNYDTNSSGGGDQLTAMAGTDFVPVPAVFIGHSDGAALLNLFQTNSAALGQIHLANTSYVFSVTNTMICEHVGLRVQADHTSRSDVRITLVSPMGTRSVLQALNIDTEPGPADWTYYSTHHFFETTAGNWTAYFSDEGMAGTGSVRSVSLILQGVPIHDRDQNGLDDFWEITYWDSIFSQKASDDPDRDGYSNAREQLMDTDPAYAEDLDYNLDLSRWNSSLARVSWASSPYYRYEVWGGTNLNALTLMTNLPGRFPETEWFTPYNAPTAQFFRVRANAN